MPDPHNWQSHFDRERFGRYHKDIFMPDYVLHGAQEFLPPVGVELILSPHYLETVKERNLPPLIRMPKTFDIIDVTLVRETWAVYRVMIRMPWFWSKAKRAAHDLCVVLEGDFEAVTAFWIKQADQHETLDADAYEREDK